MAGDGVPAAGEEGADGESGRFETEPVKPPLAPHVLCLIDALLRPESVLSLSAEDWDLLIRTAESAEMLATLDARIDAAGLSHRVPCGPARHLSGARAFHAHRLQMARHLLVGLERTLTGFPGKVVLLKGAGYAAQNARFSLGRMFDDVDILVDRQGLDEIEERLKGAGWVSQKPDAYDQHYYRAWAHELPPMRHPRYVLELDIHHTILPVTGRIRPDAFRLIQDAVRLEGSDWHVLGAPDQLLHAAAHLFQDSDCANRLREVFDIDGLVRHHASEDFWTALVQHARHHGLGRPLWYSLHFAQTWLGTPVPGPTLASLRADGPGPISRNLMEIAVRRSLPPPHPDRRPPVRLPVAQRFLLIRSVWLRLPPWLLVYHAVMKTLNSFRRRKESKAG